MANNLIRGKQLYQPDISGLVQNVITSNEYELTYNGGTGLTITDIGKISITGSQINLFNNSIDFSGSALSNLSNIDLSNIDNLFLSGVDIMITNGLVISDNSISAPNLVYNVNNQIISGVKTFINSGIFSISGSAPIGIPNNPLAVVGSGNTYVQVNIQNRATGATATADLVITANNGTDATNYINLGINNSGYNDPTFSNGSGLDGYLFVNGGSLDIGTQTPGKNLEFHIGGTTADRVIARIDNSGINIVSGTYRVNNTGVLLSGQNIFVLQGGTTQATTNPGSNYIGLGGAHIGWSTNINSRRIPILENCVARKASLTLHQATAQAQISAITGALINTTKNLIGIINTGMNSTSDDNFYNYTNENLNVPFSAGDSGVLLIHNINAIPNIRVLANVYFYN